MQGYPYYVQKLSSFAWNNTDKECTDAVVHESFRMLVASEAIDFEGMWSALTMLQKSLIKALAAEPTATPYAREYLERYGFTLGGVQKALKVLLARDLIEKTKENAYRLTDPIMGEWLK